MIPEIGTERLILRGFGRADFAAYAALWQEPEVVRFTGGEPRSLPDRWGRFLAIAGSWAIEGFGQWAILGREDGALIGQTGFFNALRGIGADFDAAPEAGWVLTAAAHGRGYAAEAVAAAHRWFDAQPFGGASHAMINLDNDRSFGLAARLGYGRVRDADYRGASVRLMRRVRGA